MINIKLERMSGLGNDFLIYDARGQSEADIDVVKNNVINLSLRNNVETKGCDQFLILRSASDADIFMEIYNSDGGEVSACGNASRCVGLKISEELNKKVIKVKTKADLLIAENLGNNIVSVNMAKPIFNWEKIPLTENVDINFLPIDIEGFERPAAVSMGNPHMVFLFNDKDVKKLDVTKIGAPLEYHSLYPERTNVEFGQVLDRSNIKLRVFERGAGETLACGTGACATAVIANKKGLCDNKINIHMNGGVLEIELTDSGEVLMKGATKYEGIVGINI